LKYASHLFSEIEVRARAFKVLLTWSSGRGEAVAMFNSERKRRKIAVRLDQLNEREASLS
jgi:hypothetical protein